MSIKEEYDALVSGIHDRIETKHMIKNANNGVSKWILEGGEVVYPQRVKRKKKYIKERYQTSNKVRGIKFITAVMLNDKRSKVKLKFKDDLMIIKVKRPV